MDDFSELQTALLSDLNATASSSLFPPATIKLALNRAYIKCARLFRWPQLEDAKKTSSQANIEYYDFPEDWSPDSAFRLEMDDLIYGEDPDGSPMAFNDYLLWKTDNTSSTEKKWAVHGTQYFIYPTPTAAGSYNISIWGQKNVDTLTNDTDETIFSHNMPECNEAIVLEAGAILKKKGEDDKKGELFSTEAKGILAVAFNKLKQEKDKYEKTQPFFEVDDMFGKTSTKDIIGNF
jgi:hypothetical protein